MPDVEPTLTPAQVRALSPMQRRELRAAIHLADAEQKGLEAGRLSIRDVLKLDAQEVSRRRRRALVITTFSALALIPWTLYLSFTLPEVHIVRGWDFSWIGFDIILTSFLAMTALLAWRRQFILVIAASGAAALLLADAWFDVTMSGRHDRRLALLTAFVIELPLAAFLLTVAFMLVRRVGRAVMALAKSAPDELSEAVSPLEPGS